MHFDAESYLYSVTVTIICRACVDDTSVTDARVLYTSEHHAASTASEPCRAN